MASFVEIFAYRRLRAPENRAISMITALGAAYVAKLPYGEVEEIYSIIAKLEGYAAGLATKRVNYPALTGWAIEKS